MKGTVLTGKDRQDSRVLGVVILGIALAVNQWTVGYLVTEDGTVDDPFVRAAIWFFDVILAFIAVWLLFRRKVIDRKVLLFRCLAVALSVVVLEGILHIVHFVEDGMRKRPTPKYLLPPYKGKEWAKQLFAEADDVQQDKRRFTYHPLLGWDAKEFHGQLVNVGPDGVREGWNPEFLPGKKVPSVYVFGGSTIWGVAVRDDHTVPSHLSRLLNSHGHELLVHNYGDIAYSFTQELINLILLLKAGHRPDYVIFYDGVNDVYASYRDGVSGRVLDCFGIREGFNRSTRVIDDFLSGAKKLLVKRCMIYHYLSRLTTLTEGTPTFPEVGARFDDQQLRHLAEEITDYYATSQALLEPLSLAFGFKYLTFWQPVALTEERLLEAEKNDIRTGDEALGKVHRHVRDLLTQRKLQNFYDISGVFYDRTTMTYIDYCHLTEEGNAVIASEIYKLLESKLDAARQAADAARPTARP